MEQLQNLNQMDQTERAIVVGVWLRGQQDEQSAVTSLDELSELVEAAGAVVVGSLIQKRERIDSATVIGSGKLAEASAAAEELDATTLVFDMELSGSQLRNIQDETKLKILDRTLVILDIFARRARSSEGQLQVELAQLKDRASRLTGMGQVLSRLGGGIGTRGPGETQLETDRRHISRRIHALSEQLKKVRRRRERTRNQRQQSDVFSVAVVGYTNAGKSTLVNQLCDAELLTMDQVFATLDPTARRLKTDAGWPIVLIDTVGFIRNLPHHLVEAFQATLEEVTNCDLVLQVTDLSDPDAINQAEIVQQELDKLGAGDKPRIHVLNKIDCLPEREGVPAAFRSRNSVQTIAVSAKTGQGLEELRTLIEHVHASHLMQATIELPYTEMALLHYIQQYGNVLLQENHDSGMTLLFRLPKSRIGPIQPYLQIT